MTDEQLLSEILRHRPSISKMSIWVSVHRKMDTDTGIIGVVKI